jgi:hypothetical protein
MKQLKIKRFDMSSIGDDKTIVLIGKRDTGKSFLTKDILWYHKEIPIGTVISASENVNKFYSYIVPKKFIHDDFSPHIISSVLQRQDYVIKKCRKEIKKKGETDIDPRAFLVLDDCLADSKAWVRDKHIRSCFMNGRHYKLLFILTCQYPLGIPPELRTNIDYVFILRENLINNRKRIYENYAGMFDSFESFCDVMNQCTENYECLVIHNNARSNRLEDQVFWYKAEQHEPFRIGASQFWNMQDKDGSDSDCDSHQEFDTHKRGKTGSLNVRKLSQ